MSGHSHWATIKHKKGAVDAKRGKLWSKLSRNIIVAAKQGGGDPDGNLSLRYAIDRARAGNMPNDTIDRAIKRGTGELGDVSYESVTFEGYGPGGVAILVEALTDNRNRVTAEVRKIFELGGGSLAGAGSVTFMFHKKGVISVKQEDAAEDRLMEIGLDAGMEDMRLEDGMYNLYCETAAFEKVKAAVTAAKIPIQKAEMTMVPANTVPCDANTGRKVLKLLDTLEDNDDVQNIHANYDIPDAVFAEIEKMA